MIKLMIKIILIFLIFMGFVQLEEECKTTEKGIEYRGTLSKTASGLQCQPWSQQSPHKQNYENDVPSGSENYCRGTSDELKPWCYTMDPNVRWEYCDVPFCQCKTTEMGTEYRGTLSKTVSGLQCQPWDQQSPHKQHYEDNVPSGSENYCRNPDNDKKPWCYTMDPNVRWEYCDVPFCPGECKTTEKGTEYRGTLSKSVSGLQCQPWSQHANLVPSGSEDYCRNPSNYLEPWCYTTDSNLSWDYCDVPFC